LRGDLDGYLSDFQRFIRTARINQNHGNILNDKLVFFLSLRTISDRVAPIIALIDKSRYMSLGFEEPRAPVSLAEGLQGLEGTAVLKPCKGSGGQRIMFYERRRGEHWVNGRRIPWADVEKTLGTDAFVVSRVIKQAKYAAEIFPKTTNTIRILTMWDYSTGETFVGAAVHRFGTEASRPVDNWSEGGLSAAIDLKEGRLGEAASFPVDGKVIWRTEHPDTGVRIAGKVIPQWLAVSNEILVIAKRLSFLPYIAWDVLATETGFCIVEGNARSDVNLLQVHGPMLTDERVRRFYEYNGVLREKRDSQR
jgi:hypothetical protein